MDAIVVENLEKQFPPALAGWRGLLHPFIQPSVRALGGVSFVLAQGDAMALIGANGAGKSTLLRILATLHPPTRGRACVAGFDVELAAPRVRQQIGYHTSSENGFYWRLSARENLQFFAALNNLVGRTASRSIASVAELMGLGPVLDRQVRTLSTGMVHRLGLARALLHAPAVLLLDEPTQSLDPLTAAEFRRFLRNDLVRERGTTLLFATHTLSEVEQIADRIAVFHAGQLLACDTPQCLRESAGVASLEQVLEKLTASTAPEQTP
jgi:ABC-type multidrug transport system ATPase subunit